METKYFSETVASIDESTRRQNPEDDHISFKAVKTSDLVTF
jgi:hypothetical protein